MMRWEVNGMDFEGYAKKRQLDNKREEVMMFKEELEDLQGIYQKGLELTGRDLEEVIPSMIMYMNRFIHIHKRRLDLLDKLDVLKQKMGEEDE